MHPPCAQFLEADAPDEKASALQHDMDIPRIRMPMLPHVNTPYMAAYLSVQVGSDAAGFLHVI